MGNVVYRRTLFPLGVLFAAVLTLLGGVHGVSAQSLTDFLSGADNLASPAGDAPKATVTAMLTLPEGTTTESAAAGDEVVLRVRVTMPSGAYTYSQNPSFGGATRISISEVYGLEPVDDAFRPDHDPKVVFEEGFGHDVEKFPGEVTWNRTFRLTGAAPADQVSIAGEIKFQVCDAQSCTPLTEAFEAFVDLGSSAETLHAGSLEQGGAADLSHWYVVRPTRPAPDPLTIQFEIAPTNAQPGETVTLAVTMALEDDWHTFGLEPHEKQISTPTSIELLETENLRPIGPVFQSVQQPDVVDQGFDGIIEHVHHGTVTWTRTFEVTGPGPYGVVGEISYQICKTSCLRVKSVPFSLGSLQQPADVETATVATQSFVPVSGTPEKTAVDAALAESSADDFLEFQLQDNGSQAGLGWYLITAFLGGLILNIMPCVLPVLAIKIMSFVQQSGEHRGRVLLLNVCYSIGVISVFLVLASLAVTLQLGWGGLFQKPEFNLVMIAIVFAMGLSMLGVFEIPIPGMVGSAGGQHREGLTGAFLTGIFATLLATPCSGPLMTPTLAWSVKQSASVVFLVWGVMGLGMASPYLLVGLFPKLIRFLPQPGMWMVRFKEFAGFALLAAAVWLMGSLDDEALIGVLIMLLALGFAVWMIGTLYQHSSPPARKFTVRGLATLVLLAGGIYGWSEYQQGVELADARRAAADLALTGGAAPESPTESAALPWQKFSGEKLTQLLREGKPVLVDFTADWCLICKTNEKVALNTEATSAFVRENGIVPLYADYTREDPEIKQWLEKFNSISVPLTVIFPAGDPQHPIILDGPYTQSTLLSYLRGAVTDEVAVREGRTDLIQETRR